MAKRRENYLDYIPVVKSDWDDGENGLVTVHMVHRGFYAWVAQKFFHRPRVSHIDLDTLGSFVFRHIDGQRTVGDLAELVKAEFGEAAEPLYDRLVQYLKILRNNGFIDYRQNR
jgi:hypothetical protein